MQCRKRAYLLAVTAFVVLALLLPARIRHGIFESGTCVYMRISNLSQPWRGLPIDDSFYKSTTRSTHAIDRAAITNLFSESWSALCDLNANETSPTITSCHEIDGVLFPLCALRDSARNTSGVVLPTPSLGSSAITQSPPTVCLDRNGRWGVYGLATAPEDGLRSQAQSELPPWSRLDLGKIQEKCTLRNKHRFENKNHREAARALRTAVVLRAWDSFHFAADDIYNLRAMITELSLASGGQFSVFLLLHVRDESKAQEYSQRPEKLFDYFHIPLELRSLVTVWSYSDTRQAYPKVGEYDVFYHNFMALQLFAQQHPEFDFFWNWEMDVRFTGHYGTLLHTLSEWTKSQEGENLKGSGGRFYMQSSHGSYESFLVEMRLKYGNNSVSNHGVAGTGSEADLITLFPLFDAQGTTWAYKDYLVNYSYEETLLPRRSSIVTNVRLSRQLLMKMHYQNQVLGHAMAAEMWASSVALQNGFKVVYAPHPIYLQNRWPPEMLNSVFSAGPQAEVGGSLKGVINHQHNFKGSTWYCDATFPLELYTRWLGLAIDGPGSERWEQDSGRMCLPGILLHPVKSRQLPYKEE